MSRPRFWLWSILLIALAGVIGYRLSELRQPRNSQVVRLAFVTGGSGPYWQLTMNGAKAAAQLENVDLKVEVPAIDENVEQQTQILSQLPLGDLDGIAISPLDADGQTGLINGLGEKIKVVTFDSDAPASKRLTHIGTSNVQAGAVCARLVNEALPQGGKIVVLLANLTKDNMRDRKAGFEEALGELSGGDEPAENRPKLVVVDYLTDGGNLETSAKNIRDSLKTNSDLAGFVGMNAFHGPVLLKTLKEANKLGQIKLVTFDFLDETLAGIESGDVYATLAQDPYRFGYDAVKSLATFARGEPSALPLVGHGTLYVSADVINKQNLADFSARLRQQQVASVDRAAK